MKQRLSLFILLLSIISSNASQGAVYSRKTSSVAQRKFTNPKRRVERASVVLDVGNVGNQKRNAVTESTGKASILTSVFNLANNVAGAGILTLAAGKASGTGWVPSILTCVTLGPRC